MCTHLAEYPGEYGYAFLSYPELCTPLPAAVKKGFCHVYKKKESEILRYEIVSNKDEEIVIRTDEGNMITLAFSKQRNAEVEEYILENLVATYESRMST